MALPQTHESASLDSIRSDLLTLYKRVKVTEDDIDNLMVKDELLLKKSDQTERTAEQRYIRSHTESAKLLDFYLTAKATLNIVLHSALANNASALPPAGTGERILNNVSGCLQLLTIVTGFTSVPMLSSIISSAKDTSELILTRIEKTHADRLKALVFDADPSTQSIIVDKIARTLTIGLEEQVIHGEDPTRYVRPDGPVGAAVGSFLDAVRAHWQRFKIYIHPRDEPEHTTIYGQLGCAYATALLQLVMADIGGFKATYFGLDKPKEFKLNNLDKVLNAFINNFHIDDYQTTKASKVGYTITRVSPEIHPSAGAGASATPTTTTNDSHVDFLKKTVPFIDAVNIIKAIADKHPTHRGLPADPWLSCCVITIASTLQGPRSPRPETVSGVEMLETMRTLYLATDDCVEDLRKALKDKLTETHAYNHCLFYHCGAAKEEVRPLNTTIAHP